MVPSCNSVVNFNDFNFDSPLFIIYNILIFKSIQ